MRPMPEQPEQGDIVSFEYAGVQITGKLAEIIEKDFWIGGAEIKDTCYRVETPAQDVIISTSIIEAYNFKIVKKGSEYARLLEARDTLLALVDPRRSPLEWEVHRILRATYTGFLAARGCLVERPEGEEHDG